MLTFMTAWNDFFWPVTLPVLVVLMLLGRQIVGGIMAGAVMG